MTWLQVVAGITMIIAGLAMCVGFVLGLALLFGERVCGYRFDFLDTSFPRAVACVLVPVFLWFAGCFVALSGLLILLA
jgi:hypothetical protein